MPPLPPAVDRLASPAPTPERGWAGLYTLPNSPRSPGLARLLVREALAGWPATVVDNAQLLVSELVTNVVRHAETEFALEIRLDQPGIRVSVEDNSSDGVIPFPAESLEADSGRGLQLVNSLATSWGWRHTATGKQVWFELS